MLSVPGAGLFGLFRAFDILSTIDTRWKFEIFSQTDRETRKRLEILLISYTIPAWVRRLLSARVSKSVADSGVKTDRIIFGFTIAVNLHRKASGGICAATSRAMNFFSCSDSVPAWFERRSSQLNRNSMQPNRQSMQSQITGTANYFFSFE
jgi:hypothetical protein